MHLQQARACGTGPFAGRAPPSALPIPRRDVSGAHRADETAAMPGAAHDLLDRHAVRPQAQDGRVGLLAAQIAITLDLLGGGEQRGIDGHSTHGAADLPHRGAHGIDEGTAGIPHQMPAVGDLGRLGQGRGGGKGIPTATITSHGGDLRLGREPSSRRRGLAVGQRGDGPAPLQIADAGPIALVPAPGPAVDADDRRRNQRWQPRRRHQKRDRAQFARRSTHQRGHRPPSPRRRSGPRNAAAARLPRPPRRARRARTWRSRPGSDPGRARAA